MNKRQLIDEILVLNKSAQPAFLARFAEQDLNEYLGHLLVARQPRLSGDARRYDKYFTSDRAAFLAPAEPLAVPAAQIAPAEPAAEPADAPSAIFAGEESNSDETQPSEAAIETMEFEAALAAAQAADEECDPTPAEKELERRPIAYLPSYRMPQSPDVDAQDESDPLESMEQGESEPLTVAITHNDSPAKPQQDVWLF